METKTGKVQNATLTIDVLIPSEAVDPIKKKMLIDYDLSPLKRLIEYDGIEKLIKNLRMLHNDIVEASLISFESGENGIFENNPDLVDQLFYIRELATCFDEIRSETYQLKSWPVVNVEEPKVDNSMN